MLTYFVNKPNKIFRSYTLGAIQMNNWDFSGRYLNSAFNTSAELSFKNRWQLISIVEHSTEEQDYQLLRGGVAFKLPSFWNYNFKLKSDPTKPISFNLGYKFTNNGLRGKFWRISPGMSFLPLQNLKVSTSLQYGENLDELQFVKKLTVGNQPRYILGRIQQKTLSATFRVDYNITPKWSIQYYGSPYASIGSYSMFKTVSNGQASSYSARTQMIQGISKVYNMNQIDENGDGVIDYQFTNPDFDFYQFRSNLVVRWEYRPGSQLYFVWSNDRTSYLNPGGNKVQDLAPELAKVSPHQVFLLKFNYWFSL